MNPLARRDGIFAENLAGEVILYDKSSHNAHCLNATTATVWDHADGQRTIGDIALVLEQKLGIPRDPAVVLLALEQLESAGLLESATSNNAEATKHNPSRRQVARRLALAGISASLIPAVASIVAPTPAMASSPGPVYTGASVTNDLNTLEGDISKDLSAYLGNKTAQADLAAGENALAQGILDTTEGNTAGAQASFSAAETDFNGVLKALGLPPL
jgi:Coenzyme PQQ synthesis protein D (PqqD)